MLWIQLSWRSRPRLQLTMEVAGGCSPLHPLLPCSATELGNPHLPFCRGGRDTPPTKTGERYHPPTTIPSGHQVPSHILFCPLQTLTSSSRLFRVFPPRKAPSPWRQKQGSQRGESRKAINRLQVFHLLSLVGVGVRGLAEGSGGTWLFASLFFPH